MQQRSELEATRAAVAVGEEAGQCRYGDLRRGAGADVEAQGAAVAGIVFLAQLVGEELGAFYTVAIVAPTALAGIAMAVMVVTRPLPRNR